MKSVRQLKIQFWNSGEILDWTYVIGSDWHIDGTGILGMYEITQGAEKKKKRTQNANIFVDRERGAKKKSLEESEREGKKQDRSVS